MQSSRIDAWALALVTDPPRALAAQKLARQRAWMRLKAQRGQTCRYPWIPASRAEHATPAGDAA